MHIKLWPKRLDQYSCVKAILFGAELGSHLVEQVALVRQVISITLSHAYAQPNQSHRSPFPIFDPVECPGLSEDLQVHRGRCRQCPATGVSLESLGSDLDGYQASHAPLLAGNIANLLRCPMTMSHQSPITPVKYAAQWVQLIYALPIRPAGSLLVRLPCHYCSPVLRVPRQAR